MYAWTSWHTTIPLTLGLLGLLAWLTYSLLVPLNPMIPLSIMANRTAALHYLGNLVHGIVQFGGLYYLPLYYQTVLAYSPTLSGVAMLPQCIIAAPFSALAAVVIAKTNSVKPLILASWICLTAGIPLFALLQPDTPVIKWIALNIPSAIGIGSLFGGLALATQAAAETSDSRTPEEVKKIKGMAASLNPFFRTLGQALGIVIAQAAFTNQMSMKAGVAYAADAAALGQLLAKFPKESKLRIELVGDYNDCLHIVWFVLCGIAGVMMLLTLAVKDVGPMGENTGFFGQGGRKMRKVKITHPTPRVVRLLQEREERVMKEPGWGIREVRKTEDGDSAFQELISPTAYSHAPASTYNGPYEPYNHGAEAYFADLPSEGMVEVVSCHPYQTATTRQYDDPRTLQPVLQSPERFRQAEMQDLTPQTPTRTARVQLPRWSSSAIDEPLLCYTSPQQSLTPQTYRQALGGLT